MSELSGRHAAAFIAGKSHGMHELSLVKSVLRQVEAICGEHGAAVARVQSIRLAVGPLAGVEPLLLESAFQQAVVECQMSGAQLIVEEVPLTASCPTCGTVPVEPVRIQCPQCGETEVTIIGGDEVRLQSITLQSEDQAEQGV